MKTIIIIDCDEDNEVIQHISVIKKQLKSAILKRRKTPEDDTDITVYDDNCYGSHKATVIFSDIDVSNEPIEIYQP